MGSLISANAKSCHLRGQSLRLWNSWEDFVGDTAMRYGNTCAEPNGCGETQPSCGVSSDKNQSRFARFWLLVRPCQCNLHSTSQSTWFRWIRSRLIWDRTILRWLLRSKDLLGLRTSSMVRARPRYSGIHAQTDRRSQAIQHRISD